MSKYTLELHGKIALVTGGSRGIGKAIALALAEKGAKIALTYARSAEAAEAVKSEIEALGSEAMIIQADAASFDGANETVSAIIQEWVA